MSPERPVWHAPGGGPAAWLAAACWGAFGALSAAWALGWDGALEGLSRDLQRDAAARETGFLALVWAAAALKLGAAALAVAVARPGRLAPWRRRAVLALRVGGVVTLLYGAVLWVEKLLMVAGAVDVPAALEDGVLGWYVLLWEPSFVVGGTLLLLAARRARLPRP
ncbi:DUF3995 domain-containing protein [Conexibacter sp. SYSU D00693]|uniref:DUF3995 domain-containing protein n=1 Tax=Conexibacter sp. SYSU D00693 TaxID=2812560 RepID=UPI00196A4E45|nr:DUF3995 domain-containing protein [Conexibacter sp. SYSU D00693]